MTAPKTCATGAAPTPTGRWELRSRDVPEGDLTIGALSTARAPALSPAVGDLLRRLPSRHDVTELAGTPVWVPRLGVTVLVHKRTSRDRWVCTATGTDRAEHEPGRLPVGMLLLSELELSRAVPTPSGRAGPDSTAAFLQAWQIRLVDHGIPLDAAAAFAAAADPASLALDLGSRELIRTLLVHAGCQSVQGFARRCQTLTALGALGSPATRPEGRGNGWVELVLPEPVWTW